MHGEWEFLPGRRPGLRREWDWGQGGPFIRGSIAVSQGDRVPASPSALGGGAHQDVQRALRALLVLFDGGEYGQHEAGEDQQEPEDRGRLGQPVGTRTRPRCRAQDTPTATPRTPHSLAHTPCLSAQPGQHRASGKAPKLSVTGNKLCLLHGWEVRTQSEPHTPLGGKGGTPYMPRVSSFTAVLSRLKGRNISLLLLRLAFKAAT